MNAIGQAGSMMYIAALTGGIAFALSGFLAGTRKNLDVMGLFILSFLAANGGGILRDLLINRTPIAVLSNEPFLLAAAVTLIGSLMKRQWRATLESQWLFVVCDAVGLVAFSITGSLIAIEIGAPFFGFLALAFLTAAGGAILRDLLINNIPEVLHGGFYGSVAIILGSAIYLLNMNGWLTPVALVVLFCAAVVMRLVAYQYDWNLPKL